ncbi:hypothetical protein NDU88_008388 [Pleurodeles waltl]|uniref:Uncharacterized protein n=1 Tax=Pleurodeles waltl TaxID=8319 RepID=A0AAV7RWQ5_PLEWA|nr:hypothetical protein NDU88_008388 [Pleurodeles waltl]
MWRSRVPHRKDGSDHRRVADQASQPQRPGKDSGRSDGVTPVSRRRYSFLCSCSRLSHSAAPAPAAFPFVLPGGSLSSLILEAVSRLEEKPPC